MRSTRRGAAIAAALAIAVTAAGGGVAQAKAPPKGTYQCEFAEDGSTYGLVKILGSTSYGWNSSGKGTYKTRGSAITWKTGKLKGVYKHARWRKASGLTLIELYDGRFGHSQLDVRCIKRKH
jgi:hypothetical protein